MQWSTVCSLLISSVLIASCYCDGLRHKRNLSLLKKLFSNGVERSQIKCIKTQNKPSRQYELFVFPSQQSYGLETVPQRRRKNNNNFVITSIRQFLTSDTLHETSKAIGEMITTLLSGDSSISEENKQDATHKPQDVAGQSFTIEHKPKITITPEYPVPIDDNKNSKTFVMSPIVSFMSPIISMPRKYSYEQIRNKGVQTFSLDSNLDVRVTETSNRVPRPAFVEDRIKDVILSVPSSPHQQFYYGNTHVLNKDDVIKPNVFQEGEITNIKTLSRNDKSMYVGNPIIVVGNDSNTMNKIVSTDGGENNIGRNIKEKQRGDIPEYHLIK